MLDLFSALFILYVSIISLLICLSSTKQSHSLQVLNGNLPTL